MAWELAGNWFYSGNPADSDRDHVRYLIGDVDRTDPLASDEEIQFAVDNRSDVYAAASEVASSIAARFSRDVSTSVSTSGVGQHVTRQLQQRASQYLALAAKLTSRSTRVVTPYMGGKNVSDKEIDRGNTDLVQPHFILGQFDNP